MNADEIQKLSQSALVKLESITALTATKDEENIFHLGFFTGFCECSEQTFTIPEIESVLSSFMGEVQIQYFKTNFIERLQQMKNLN